MSYLRAKNTIIDIANKTIVDSYYNLKKNEIYVGVSYKKADNIVDLIEEGDLCEFLIEEDKKIISSFTIKKTKYADLYCTPGISFMSFDILSLYIKDENGKYCKIAEKKGDDLILL